MKDNLSLLEGNTMIERALLAAARSKDFAKLRLQLHTNAINSNHYMLKLGKIQNKDLQYLPIQLSISTATLYFIVNCLQIKIIYCSHSVSSK